MPVWQNCNFMPQDKNLIAPYTSPLLSAMPSISHGFFTRKGGVSEGIYESCNCGWGSNDNKKYVRQNRTRVAGALGIQMPQLLSLYQIHSAEVITVQEGWDYPNLPKADAMVTAQRGIALGVLAADCVPVLFADAKAGVIGAAHSGWKGALAGVIGTTVEAMHALGAREITAAIGPAIGQASYEVGKDLYDAVTAKHNDATRFFAASAKAGHWQFDVKGFVYDALERAGVAAINMLENNTYLEEDAFFSYRRATHRVEPDYGRQISAIVLQS